MPDSRPHHHRRQACDDRRACRSCNRPRHCRQRHPALGRTSDIRALAGRQTRIVDAGHARSCRALSKATCTSLRAPPTRSPSALRHPRPQRSRRRRPLSRGAPSRSAALLQAQGADYTIISERQRVTRHHLDRPSATAPSPWRRRITIRCGPTRRRSSWPASRRQALGPGNEIVMGADGLAEGELREGEAYRSAPRLGRRKPRRLGLATGGEPDPDPTPQSGRMTAPS